MKAADRTNELSPPALQAVAVSQRFGGATALDDVSLAIGAGDLTALIGPNGAGKSTLFDILAGDRRPTAGEVLLHGRDVTRAASHRHLAGGLGRTFQIPRPFAAMTLVENVMIGAQRHPGERILPNWFAPRLVAAHEREVHARAMELLDFVSLAPLARQPARVLSGGQRKLLELARVLMARPRVVLLDEPAAGVAPALLEVLIARIAELNEQGTSFLVIEHNMDMVAALCRRVLVLAAGRILCDGTPHEVTRDPRVIAAYLGSDAA